MPVPNLNTFASKPLVMVASTQGKLCGFDMKGIFPNGGLTGTPAVVSIVGNQLPIQTYPATQVPTPGAVAANDLTITGAAVNTGSFQVQSSGRIVLAGEGVQAHIANGVDGGNYLLQITGSDGITTDSLFVLLQIRGAGQPSPY